MPGELEEGSLLRKLEEYARTGHGRVVRRMRRASSGTVNGDHAPVPISIDSGMSDQGRDSYDRTTNGVLLGAPRIWEYTQFQPP